MNTQDKAAEVIRTWQKRHKNIMDENPDWAAQNLAGDLHNAGLFAPDLTKPQFNEDGLWQECEEDPEIFVIAGGVGVPKRFIGIGLFNDDGDQLTIQARPAEEMRELAYALLAAAEHQGEA